MLLIAVILKIDFSLFVVFSKCRLRELLGCRLQPCGSVRAGPQSALISLEYSYAASVCFHTIEKRGAKSSIFARLLRVATAAR